MANFDVNEPALRFAGNPVVLICQVMKFWRADFRMLAGTVEYAR